MYFLCTFAGKKIFPAKAQRRQRAQSRLFSFFILFGSAAVLFTTFACQTPEKPRNTVPTATATPEKPKIKTFNGKGKVTKINLEIGSVELDHEEIPGIMPPMIMEFSVTKKSELEALKIGDTVDFVLEDNAGAEKIISINKSK